jgi:hypothetical protein
MLRPPFDVVLVPLPPGACSFATRTCTGCVLFVEVKNESKQKHLRTYLWGKLRIRRISMLLVGDVLYTAI